jgi:hypothetical protein
VITNFKSALDERRAQLLVGALVGRLKFVESRESRWALNNGHATIHRETDCLGHARRIKGKGATPAYLILTESGRRWATTFARIGVKPVKY